MRLLQLYPTFTQGRNKSETTIATKANRCLKAVMVFYRCFLVYLFLRRPLPIFRMLLFWSFGWWWLVPVGANNNAVLYGCLRVRLHSQIHANVTLPHPLFLNAPL